jgi:tRNA threonylcarbamoyladenosine biosynthesis protein TsaB
MTDAPILALDASAGGASVALLRGDVVLHEATLPRQGSAEALAPAVAAMLGDAGVRVSALGAIVVGMGPGSFTGLRVAAALAVGLAHGAGRPVRLVPSLALVVAGAVPALVPGGYVAVLDALRGDWFAQRCDVRADGTVAVTGPRELATRDAVLAMAAVEGRTVVGPPVEAALVPHARGAGRLVAVAAPAGWEPDYGRLAEAQVQWEAAHGRPLPAA